MPTISKFYGITIYMYFLSKEHNPSHIHAYYGNYSVSICISNGKIIEGSFPINALNLVREWLEKHKTELEDMWNKQEFKKIDSLEEETSYVS